ncbi:MAG: pyridoxine 5'-phosphate synthase [Polaromonas sp.]|nr:pyridoxine 5'-phosphate synthase [Polaromonas sp.]
MHKTALSVNVNKVALLRNTRHLGIPDVVRAARLCLEAGANGITVHPRPDERHVRSVDVFEIAAMMKDWPDREFNIEGNPFQNLMGFVQSLSARGLPLHQCTFVPDSEDQFTSDHGWVFPDDAERLKPLIDQVHARGARVSLFMDPIPEAMAGAKAVGADRVEFYTESYASACGTDKKLELLSRFTQSARAAAAIDLGVNAGHDLNRNNLTEFLKAVPGVLEVSIGHALVADALELGYKVAVQDYLRCIDKAFAGQ